MSARLIMVSRVPSWNASDYLDAVEHRCRKLIEPAADAQNNRFDEAARAATYHLQIGGRRIRARLALDAAQCLGLTASTAIILATTCELLHNASLIHDDVQDRDTHRRGAAAVWQTFGDATAICAGDLLLSSAYACLAELDDRTSLTSMLSLLHARTAEAIQGQTADVAHHTRPVKDIDTYLRIVAGKSGALLSLPLELALLAAGQTQWCGVAREAAHAFAIGYQIADDLDDLDKDAGTEARAPALNLVWLLRQQLDAGGTRAGQANLRAKNGTPNTPADVDAYCIALARDHLALAKDRANALPQQCGALLAQLSVQLHGRLQVDALQIDG